MVSTIEAQTRDPPTSRTRFFFRSGDVLRSSAAPGSNIYPFGICQIPRIWWIKRIIGSGGRSCGSDPPFHARRGPG